VGSLNFAACRRTSHCSVSHGYSLFWQEHRIHYVTYFGVVCWERGKKQKLHVLGIHGTGERKTRHYEIKSVFFASRNCNRCIIIFFAVLHTAS